MRRFAASFCWMVGWIGVRLQKLVVPSVRENVCDLFGVVVKFRCANFSASRQLFYSFSFLITFFPPDIY